MVQFYFKSEREAVRFIEAWPYPCQRFDNFIGRYESGVNMVDEGYNHLISLDTGGDVTISLLW